MNNYKDKILALILSAFLCSCATTGASKIEKIEIKKAPNKEYILSCVKPGLLETGSFEEITLKLNETAHLLNACSNKQKNLVNYIKENFN